CMIGHTFKIERGVAWLAIHTNHFAFRIEAWIENLAPMPHTTANVRGPVYRRQTKPVPQQVEIIAVPEKIALRAKIFGRMGTRPFCFGHSNLHKKARPEASV